jgi:DNA-binding NtrC family response regulator
MTGLKNRVHILVAEDSSCVADLLRLFLQGEGYQVSTAESVADALEITRRSPVQLLVSDFRLKDGTACELMRELSKRQPISGVIISGYSDPLYRDQSKEAGFSEYLVKPVERDDLVTAVARALG